MSKPLQNLDVSATWLHNSPAADRVHAPATSGDPLVRRLPGSPLRFFRKLYEYWMAFGLAIGVIMTPIQLFLIYIVVFGGARVVTLLGGRDLLDRRMTPRSTFWHSKQPQTPSVEMARHQF